MVIAGDSSSLAAGQAGSTAPARPRERGRRRGVGEGDREDAVEEEDSVSDSECGGGEAIEVRPSAARWGPRRGPTAPERDGCGSFDTSGGDGGEAGARDADSGAGAATGKSKLARRAAPASGAASEPACAYDPPPWLAQRARSCAAFLSRRSMEESSVAAEREEAPASSRPTSPSPGTDPGAKNWCGGAAASRSRAASCCHQGVREERFDGGSGSPWRKRWIRAAMVEPAAAWSPESPMRDRAEIAACARPARAGQAARVDAWEPPRSPGTAGAATASFAVGRPSSRRCREGRLARRRQPSVQ